MDLWCGHWGRPAGKYRRLRAAERQAQAQAHAKRNTKGNCKGNRGATVPWNSALPALLIVSSGARHNVHVASDEQPRRSIFRLHQ
jgi:hypothetical protein